MQYPQKILACTDLSPAAHMAIQRALQLSATVQGQCTVLSVIPQLWLQEVNRHRPEQNSLKAQARFIEPWRQALNAQVNAVPSQTRCPRVTSVVVGHPAQCIIAQARCEGSQWIVMGRHGCAQAQPALLGSTLRAVLHDAPCPTLIVSRSQRLPYQKVLLAMDLHPEGAALIGTAQRLAPGRPLVLAHVLHIATQALQRLGLLSDSDIPRCHEAVLVDSYARLGMMALRAGLAPGQFQIEILQASSAMALLEHAQQYHYDLIVSAHARPTRSIHQPRTILGSFTQTLVSLAPCDVLVVPSSTQASQNSP